MTAPWKRLRDCTIPALWHQLVAERPEQEALVYPFRDLRLTYGQVNERTMTLARALLAAGLAKGDRVTLWAANVPEWILFQLALARVGAILVTANTSLRPQEIVHVLRHSRSTMVLHTAGPAHNPYSPAIAKARGRLPWLRTEVFLDQAEATGSIGMTLAQFEATAANVDEDAVRAREESQAPSDVINMQYTSGTTGRPKGVMLTHRNLMNNAWGLGQEMRLAPGERLALTVPLFHCFGCVVGTLGTLNSAGTICAIDEFSAAAALDLVAREGCHVIHGVPTQFRMMLEEQERQPRDLSSLRTGIMAGAPCPEALVRRVVTELRVPQLVVAYGLTECSPGVTISQPEDSLEVRSTTVGRPLPDIEIRVVDPGTSEDLPAGERGELWVRGHCVMRGYHDDPEATSRVLHPDGWLRTGDLAVLRPDGLLRIVGRLKEVIIKGGENVDPAEVEEALREHPAVRDAAVFGLPDEKWGEQIHAALLLRDGVTEPPSDLTGFLSGRLAGIKIPAGFHVVDAFPMTASGKVQKFRLAQQFGPASKD